MALAHYWKEVRNQNTSNSGLPAGVPAVALATADRDTGDTYLRSIWNARITYVSDGSSSLYGWWAAAYARLVISWDPFNAQDPSDVGDNDSLTLGFADLMPHVYKLPPTNAYAVEWNLQGKPLVLETSRKGNGGADFPNVLASIFFSDTNGFWALAAESTGLKRYHTTGRVLWGSTVP